MNINTAFTCVIAATIAFSTAKTYGQQSVGEKSAQGWDKTKAKTKEVTKKVVKTTKDAANRVEAAVREPDADAKKVDVKVTDSGVQMPRSLQAGKTAFVVTNTGSGAHNFEIEGQALDKSFWFALAPKQSKTMQVNLKPGTYDAHCTVGGHEGKEQKLQLVVK